MNSILTYKEFILNYTNVLFKCLKENINILCKISYFERQSLIKQMKKIFSNFTKEIREMNDSLINKYNSSIILSSFWELEMISNNEYNFEKIKLFLNNTDKRISFILELKTNFSEIFINVLDENKLNCLKKYIDSLEEKYKKILCKPTYNEYHENIKKYYESIKNSFEKISNLYNDIKKYFYDEKYNNILEYLENISSEFESFNTNYNNLNEINNKLQQDNETNSKREESNIEKENTNKENILYDDKNNKKTLYNDAVLNQNSSYNNDYYKKEDLDEDLNKNDEELKEKKSSSQKFSM